MEEHEILIKAKEKYEKRGDKVQLEKVLRRLKKFEQQEKDIITVVETPKEVVKSKGKKK